MDETITARPRGQQPVARPRVGGPRESCGNPRVVWNACRTIGAPSQHKEQIAEPVEILDGVGRDRGIELGRKRHHPPFRPTANGAPTPDEAQQSDTNEDAEEDHSSGSDTSDDGAGPAELNGAAQPKGKARWGVTRAKADRIGRLRWLASKWTELKGRAKEYHGHRWQKYHIHRGMQARSRISMQPELLAVMQAGGMTH